MNTLQLFLPHRSAGQAQVPSWGIGTALKDDYGDKANTCSELVEAP